MKFYVHKTARGSYRVGEQWRDEFGVELIDRLDNIHNHDRIIINGYINEYREIRCKEKYIVWHSPVAQSELDGELEYLNEIKDYDWKAFIVINAKQCEVFSLIVDAPVIYIPNFVSNIPTRKVSEKRNEEKKKVAILSNTHARKNIVTSVGAAAKLGAEVYMHKPKSEAKRAIIEKMAEVKYVDYLGKKEYYDLIECMDVSIQTTFSEGYNYVAAESLMLGTPCITGYCAPATEIGLDDYLRVVEPTNPEEIYDQMVRIIEHGIELRKAVKEQFRRYNEKRKKIATKNWRQYLR